MRTHGLLTVLGCLSLGAMVAVVSSHATACPVQEAAAYYAFNGNYEDGSGHGLDGAAGPYGGPAFVPGVLQWPGQAAHFNGVGSRVDVPDGEPLDITDRITITMHVKISRCSVAEVLLAKRVQGGDMNYVIEWGSAPGGGCVIEFVYGSLAGGLYPVYMAPATLNDGQWHCIGFSLTFGQPASAMWVIDGVVVPGVWKYGNGTTDPNCGTQLPTANNYPLTIGGQLSTSPGWFLGDIDDLRIYNCDLSASEISAACYIVVENEERTWGSIKNVYR